MGQHVIFDVVDDYFWCLHCERAYSWEEWEATKWERCPSGECDGNAIDAESWSEHRANHKGWPVVPVRGQFYPLYGK